MQGGDVGTLGERVEKMLASETAKLFKVGCTKHASTLAALFYTTRMEEFYVCRNPATGDRTGAYVQHESTASPAGRW